MSILRSLVIVRCSIPGHKCTEPIPPCSSVRRPACWAPAAALRPVSSQRAARSGTRSIWSWSSCGRRRRGTRYYWEQPAAERPCEEPGANAEPGWQLQKAGTLSLNGCKFNPRVRGLASPTTFQIRIRIMIILRSRNSRVRTHASWPFGVTCICMRTRSFFST